MNTEDGVQIYARSIGVRVAQRIVLVEGTTDADIFKLAAGFEHQRTGIELLGADLAISAAGTADQGGTSGVIKHFLYLRGNASTCLLPNGRLKYRIIALFDNDAAGKGAIRNLMATDSAIVEYRDVFRLWQSMPTTGNIDPTGLRKLIETANTVYKGLDCEIEDFLSREFVEAFLAENPTALRKPLIEVGDRIHWEFTADGKSRLHHYVKKHAIALDIVRVTDLLKSLRCYVGLR